VIGLGLSLHSGGWLISTLNAGLAVSPNSSALEYSDVVPSTREPALGTKILLTLVLTPASSGIVNMGRNGFACGTVHVRGEEHGAA